MRISDKSMEEVRKLNEYIRPMVETIAKNQMIGRNIELNDIECPPEETTESVLILYQASTMNSVKMMHNDYYCSAYHASIDLISKDIKKNCAFIDLSICAYLVGSKDLCGEVDIEEVSKAIKNDVNQLHMKSMLAYIGIDTIAQMFMRSMTKINLEA